MVRSFRFLLPLFPLLVAIPAFAGTKWTDPSPEELKMTADPAVPGAAAVYLFLEQTADDREQRHTYYARIKVLTEAGRGYADVVMPYWNKEEKIKGIEGRTIHSDGTVVPFAGKPWQKELVKDGGVRFMEKGFSLPDVQVGSILEYRYETTYDDLWAPKWYIQQAIPVLRAHYHFNQSTLRQVLETRYLPPDAQQQADRKKGWDLVVHDIPPQADEEDSPPEHSLGYRVLFYYSVANTPDQFWQQQGAFWTAGVNFFAAPDPLKSIVAQLTAPGDTDEQKLRKIYAAMMTLDNTNFTRQHSEEEDKAEKVKVRTAADIWEQKRGNEPAITLLFIGLARAAGLKAYAMKVTSRDEDVFQVGHLDWDQLDDTIAIVNLGGKEMYFDPGERYCEFGKLHWKHSWTGGLRQAENGGVKLSITPLSSPADTTITRNADLTEDADGQVHGNLNIVMTGSAALFWRQEALVTDEKQATKEFGDGLQELMPTGTTAKLQTFGDLRDYSHPLTATLEVSGTMGTRSGKRLLLPGAFFEAQTTARFATENRVNPVYLKYADTIQDEVKMKLPSGAVAELKPTNTEIPLRQDADFKANYEVSGNVYHASRQETMAGILYPATDYPALREFFQEITAQDQSQLVLTLSPKVAGVTPGTSE